MKRFIVLLAIVSMSCTGVQIKRVTDENRDAEGLRYYRPHPYLLVSEGEDGVIQSKVIMLPDKNEEYVISTSAGFGKVDLKVKLDQGWNLVELGEVSDSQTADNLKSLSDILDVLSVTAFQEIGPLKPGLYVFIYEDGLISGIRKIF